MDTGYTCPNCGAQRNSFSCFICDRLKYLGKREREADMSRVLLSWIIQYSNDPVIRTKIKEHVEKIEED